MRVRNALIIAVLALLLLSVSGCAPGSGKHTPDDPAGFFTGIWHGWIAPITLIWGFFNECIRIYEVHNTGWWYDFGFYMAVIGGFGSLALIRRKKSKKDD